LFPLGSAAIFWAISLAHPSGLPSLWQPVSAWPLISKIPEAIRNYIILGIILYALAALVVYVWDRFISQPYVRVLNCMRESTPNGNGRLRFSFALTGRAKEDASVEVYTEDGQAAAGKHYLPASTPLEFARRIFSM
jgi:hypothetical protein